MPASDTYARFYNHPKLNVPESRKLGKQHYDDAIYIEIYIRGDKNTSFSRPKKSEDENTYPREWREFDTGQSIPLEGSPLNVLPNISPATEKNLNAEGVRTVEDLANLSDAVVLGVQGRVDLRKRAVAYLAAIDPPDEKKTRRKRNKETGKLE
jgi:predicted flap endonuclease-1-like 5' DNA nuclease